VHARSALDEQFEGHKAHMRRKRRPDDEEYPAEVVLGDNQRGGCFRVEEHSALILPEWRFRRSLLSPSHCERMHYWGYFLYVGEDAATEGRLKASYSFGRNHRHLDWWKLRVQQHKLETRIK
jgi:hypothetical protein